MTKLRAWISAARLRTLPLSISGILVAGAAALLANSFSTPVFVLALLTTLGLQILSNFANDYGDGVKGTDSAGRVGPMRALQSGLISRQEMKRGMIITSVITLLLASMLIFSAFGNKNIILSFVFFNLGIAAVIAAIKYTVGKSAYGYRAMGDVFVFLFFGLVGVMGCYFLFTQSLGDWIILPAISIGLMSTAVLNLNNMRDREADALVDKNTLAVVLGRDKVKLYHTALIVVAFFAAVSYFLLVANELLDYIPLIAFVPLFMNVVKVHKVESHILLDPELKKVALSTFLFSILFFLISYF
ncbi:1,4-dihydroxy-2-naphthoate octaprenyltransferase [Patiriisocius marinistellae]|uniref:1,4-dihydroxy-2-naphthoate octaprenyltransferase n=1 Tax=Patiriisocius marinistellae TaxID=2494560 RepID=A0A5J4FZA8_9FLAO|nr:1,4-dihydroxy-2-naphthoate octaprenyltransferase [Patiriisocius marinistellae]GEQ86582.1 1,4-dihydroxy-2-naphthoate octaprenyltransferase [Patiriisocius marinistellae]